MIFKTNVSPQRLPSKLISIPGTYLFIMEVFSRRQPYPLTLKKVPSQNFTKSNDESTYLMRLSLHRKSSLIINIMLSCYCKYNKLTVHTKAYTYI